MSVPSSCRGADWLLLLADSELAALQADGGRWRLRLSAAQVRRPGARADELGWARGVTLQLDGVVGVAPAAAAGRIAQGRIRQAAGWQAALPLPGRLDGPLEIELALAQGPIAVRAVSLLIEAGPDFLVRESLAC